MSEHHTQRRSPDPADQYETDTRPTQRQRLNDGTSTSTSSQSQSRTSFLQHRQDGYTDGLYSSQSQSNVADGLDRAPYLSSGQGSIPQLSPPRRRQSPLSHSAWSSLHDRLSQPRNSLPSYPQTAQPVPLPSPPQLLFGAPNSARLLPLAALHSDLSRQSQQPSGLSRRIILPIPRSSTDVFSRAASQVHTSASSAEPTSLGERSQVIRPLVARPSHMSRPVPSRLGTTPVVPLGATLVVPASGVGTGGTLAALLTDILGLGGRRAVQMEQYRQESNSPNAAATPFPNQDMDTPHSITESLSGPSPRPSFSRETATTAPPPVSPLPTLIGGTSIVVQGAMISRMHSGDVHAPESAPITSISANAELASEEQGHQSSRREGSGDTSSSQPSLATSESSNSSSLVATIEEQASMLSRLLSIAAAATAASLLAPASSDAASGTVPAVGVYRPSASSQYASSDQRDDIRGRANSVGSTSSSRSSIFPLSALPGLFFGSRDRTTQRHTPSSHGSSEPTGIRGRLSSLASSLRLFSSRHRSQADALASQNTSHAPAPQNTSHAPAPSSHMSSTTPQGLASQASEPVRSVPVQHPNLQSMHDEDRQQEMTLSEMIHDAIRAESASGDGLTGGMPNQDNRQRDNHQSASEPASSDDAVPLPVHLQNVLRSVRENRLHPGSEGSFENWLTGLGGDLSMAVRHLSPGHNATQDEAAEQLAVGQESVPSDLRTRAAADTAPQQAPAGPSASSIPDLGDVEHGQLSFFRLFRFDGNQQGTSHQAESSNSAAEDLIPCVAVGVRSQTTQASMQARTPPAPSTSSQTSSPNATEAVRPPGANEAAAAPSQAEPLSASRTSTADGTQIEDENPASRFLILVSGGHYPRNHPLLTTPLPMAAREYLILIEVLANLNGAAAAAAVAAAARKEKQTVSKEDIEQSGLKVRKWKDIKGSSVEADAAERSTITTTAPIATVNTSSSELVEVAERKVKTVLALRAGDRCGICLEEWKDTDSCRVMRCNHVYHATCVDEWLQKSSNTCPMCRVQAVEKAMPTQDSGATTTL